MSASRPPQNRWLSVLIVMAAVALWIYNQGHPGSGVRTEHRPPPSRTAPDPIAPGNSKDVQKAGRYEVYKGCTLVDFRNNDGDSFMLRLPDGRQNEFRLYFVDTPESAFKSYRGGETNRERIDDQAYELGGITPEQAVEIGQKAKHFTLDLLASRPFTIYTEWDSPYHDNRFHAHVEVMIDGKPRWLHEVLVEHGFVRLKTKPADLPDGISAGKEKEILRQLEGRAKSNKVGVWAL